MGVKPLLPSAFVPFCVGILRESEGQKAYCVHCFHCLISWFGSAFGSKTASPSFRTRMRFFSELDDCCDGSLNSPNCQAWTASLEPISSFLQRVQETHEELMAGEGVGLITGDAVERSNSIRITEPNRITALFHSDSFLFNRPDSIG